uniref:CSN12-like protein n=1 Tax=Panagrolaimus sp. JU765 TaxID=591449 RepID=A0AC34RC63_9BILA
MSFGSQPSNPGSSLFGGGTATSMFGGGSRSNPFSQKIASFVSAPSSQEVEGHTGLEPKTKKDPRKDEFSLDDMVEGEDDGEDESRDLDDQEGDAFAVDIPNDLFTDRPQGDAFAVDIPNDLFTDRPHIIDSLEKYYATVKWYIDRNNWTASLLISDLLFLRDPHVFCKFLQVEKPNIPIDVKDPNFLFAEIISCHLSVIYYVVNQEWHKAYCMQQAMVSVLFEKRIKKDKHVNWYFPLLYPLCLDLKTLARKAEELQVRDEDDTENFNAIVSNLLMSIFAGCVSDADPSPLTSKKIAIFQLTLVLFQIYFEANNLHPTKTLIRAIEVMKPSLRHRITLSELVTYNFYLGKKAMIDSNLSLANKSFEYAFTNCPEKYFEHKKQILLYWIPVKMILGEIPTSELLEQYGFSQFKNIVEAVRDGNIRQFRETIQSNKDFLIQSGVYLIFQKLVQEVYLSLFKRLVEIHGGNRFKLDMFLHLLKFQGECVNSTDDAMCILSNLIAKKKIKGYISLKYGIVVLSKKNPFG